MKLIDLQHPFYRPLWIRLVMTAVCLGWAAFEFIMGEPFWAILFGAVGVYCLHQFFIAFNPREPDPKDKP